MYYANRCPNTGRIIRNDALSTKGAKVVLQNRDSEYFEQLKQGKLAISTAEILKNNKKFTSKWSNSVKFQFKKKIQLFEV